MLRRIWKAITGPSVIERATEYRDFLNGPRMCQFHNLPLDENGKCRYWGTPKAPEKPQEATVVAPEVWDIHIFAVGLTQPQADLLFVKLLDVAADYCNGHDAECAGTLDAVGD